MTIKRSRYYTLISKTVKMKWSFKYKKYYVNKGYLFTNIGDEFDVDINDISSNSNKKVSFSCDYCGKLLTATYQNYNKRREDSPIKKDCCIGCSPIKIKESNLITYGVESTNQVKEIRDKQKKTSLERYGNECSLLGDEIRKHIVEHFVEKYGYNTPAKNANIIEKTKNTNIERYGFVSPTLNEDVRNKQLKTMKSKYGVLYPMQYESFKEKARVSLYQGEHAPISRQQAYIHSVIGGELNYPVLNYSLDIAFPDEKLYVECDFGGHWLQIKFGNVSKEEFNEIEKRRYYALYRRGWRQIRLINTHDKVPSEEHVLKMLEYAKEYLKEHSWIKFYLEQNRVNGKSINTYYNFGDLHYLYA